MYKVLVQKHTKGMGIICTDSYRLSLGLETLNPSYSFANWTGNLDK